jgi:hypothetical protein
MDEPREGGQPAAGVSLLGMDQTLVLSETLGSGPHSAALEATAAAARKTLRGSNAASDWGTPDLATPSGPSPNREWMLDGRKGSLDQK